MFRKCGGATLLLALWLCIAPAMQAGPAEAFRHDVKAAALVEDRFAAEEASVAEHVAAARGDSSDGDGPDDPASLGPDRARSSLFAHARLSGVPEATGPPAASPSSSYQARAPPLR